MTRPGPVIPAWEGMAGWKHASSTNAATGDERAGSVEPCDACGRRDGYSTSPREDAREGHACLACGCIARQRAALRVLYDALAAPSEASVRLTEQASRLHLVLRPRVAAVTGSEYLAGLRQRLRVASWLLRHGVVEWPRHSDVTCMSDADARHDALVSLDVLEHVSEATAALREFARVLKPGGILVLTVPFYARQEANVRIADVDGQGGIRHFGTPEFHGDPLSGGVACFHHFGWALLQDLRDAGFSCAEACRVQDPSAGIPDGIWVIGARR